MKIVVAIEGQERVVGDLESAQSEFSRELRQLIRTTAKSVQTDAQASVPVFTGALRDRIRMRTSHDGMVATVRARARHAHIVAHGRKAGRKMPPPESLRAWAAARGMPGKEYILARAIGRKGTRPIPLLDVIEERHRPAFLVALEQLVTRFTQLRQIT